MKWKGLKMDVKFSSAIHMLILISESKEVMTSEQIAQSIGTNASYIRKLAGYLKKLGIIKSSKGMKGFHLNREAEKISLLDIYLSVTEKENMNIFDIHCNPNDDCIVGHHIKPTLNNLFNTINSETEKQLKSKTLEDCIENMKNIIKIEEMG